jgi:hypothetical protein
MLDRDKSNLSRDGFTLIVRNMIVVQNILVQKALEDKIIILNPHKILEERNKNGNRGQFTKYINNKFNLY